MRSRGERMNVHAKGDERSYNGFSKIAKREFQFGAQPEKPPPK
jgi:hypothetical protein